MDPFAQANPWAAAAYGIPPYGIGSQATGNIPFGVTQPLTGLGLQGQQTPGQAGFGQQITPLGLQSLMGGGQPGSPFAPHLSQLLPQTWLGAAYGSPIGQHLLQQYAQALLAQQGGYGSPFGQQAYGSPFGQQGGYGSPFGHQPSPFTQTGTPFGQTGNPLQQQSPWAQMGYGAGGPFGQAGSPLTHLNPQWALQSLYGPAFAQQLYGRVPFGHGGYPFM
jgi:hypothetical protein